VADATRDSCTTGDLEANTLSFDVSARTGLENVGPKELESTGLGDAICSLLRAGGATTAVPVAITAVAAAVPSSSTVAIAVLRFERRAVRVCDMVGETKGRARVAVPYTPGH